VSMARCGTCERLIDTDAHPEACTDTGFICDWCAQDGVTPVQSREDFEADRADAQNDEAFCEARS
jgi:hypothetical protein